MIPQGMFAGIRSSTTRPANQGPHAPLAQISQLQAQRDNSLNAARTKYGHHNPQSKRYSNTSQVLGDGDQENAGDAANFAAVTAQDQVNYKKPANSKPSKQKQDCATAPFRSINNQSSKPPVVLQSTESPPSCSLTCSPDRTIKKPTSRDTRISDEK